MELISEECKMEKKTLFKQYEKLRMFSDVTRGEQSDHRRYEARAHRTLTHKT